MSFFSRLFSALLTLFIVSVVIFAIFQVIPGDAVLNRLGIDADPVLVELLREQLQLDLPPVQRYVHWIVRALQGNLGTSLRFDSSVVELINSRLPNTLLLSLMAFGEVLLLGLPLGIWLANHPGVGGLIGGALVQVLLATPVFALSIALMLIFCIWLNWLPISVFNGWEVGIGQLMRSLILPSFAISLPSVAVVVRYLQSALNEQRNQDYVRTARNKGLNENQILRHHLLRNALIPVLTILGIILINTLGGSIVVETAFSIPGIGQLLNTAIRARDLPLVQGISLYITSIVVLGYLILDVLYAWVDPRIAGGGADR